MNWGRFRRFDGVDELVPLLTRCLLAPGTGSSSSMVGRLQGLPAHQQLLICCAAQRLSLAQASITPWHMREAKHAGVCSTMFAREG